MAGYLHRAPKHSHLAPRQFNKVLRKDPGETKKTPIHGGNISKTMEIDRPRMPPKPKVHPHRRHAGVRSHRAR